MEDSLWKHIQTVKSVSPLIHSITNLVVMNNTANALLAVGASPIMAHAHEEVKEMVGICQSLVANIGTIDEYIFQALTLAVEAANVLGKPWVLDPVGAGATSFRDKILSELLVQAPVVIRGNASEILALAKVSATKTKGADSTVQSDEAIDAARYLCQRYGTIVCVSGKKDIIVSENRLITIANGSPLMTKVTGLGCSATAVIGAFVAVVDDKVEAVAAATALFSICGELAAKQCNGPGSLQVLLLDKLYNLTEREFNNHLRIHFND
ncbi:hydroxyethylthiazole kinase [Olivibacter sp. SDN3]|uniref:hydroxyethylthiazole kinase n=1 Tax=Olivibacter sp. SDN3 TaxID=2764720 RepID=UPI001650F47E|nr:hydroxyethylthiazole kinase [Olivibacter sp. SDN3]QNL49029.1 hydroxyethylthiazole kinase [Olivibacter sp. SDN3]